MNGRPWHRRNLISYVGICPPKRPRPPPFRGGGRHGFLNDVANGNESAKLLGAALRSCRVSQGLSMRALAKQIGLSAHGRLVDYEHGRRIPPEDLLVACEKALRVDDERLLRLRHEALAELAEIRATELLAANVAAPTTPNGFAGPRLPAGASGAAEAGA